MYDKSKDVFDSSVERVRLGLDNGTWVNGESVNLVNRDQWNRFEIKGSYTPAGAIVGIYQDGTFIYSERRQKDGSIESSGVVFDDEKEKQRSVPDVSDAVSTEKSAQLE